MSVEEGMRLETETPWAGGGTRKLARPAQCHARPLAAGFVLLRRLGLERAAGRHDTAQATVAHPKGQVDGGVGFGPAGSEAAQLLPELAPMAIASGPTASTSAYSGEFHLRTQVSRTRRQPPGTEWCVTRPSRTRHGR